MRLGCPFRFLELDHFWSFIRESVSHSPSKSVDSDVIASGMLRWANARDHWKLWLSQFWFHHMHRTCGASQYIPSCLSAFPFEFPRQVGWASLGSFALDPISLWERSDVHRNGAQRRRSHPDPREADGTSRAASVNRRVSCWLYLVLALSFLL